MPKKKLHGTCLITFKNPQSAVKAKRALPEELLFYGQRMVVMPYIPSSASWRRTVSSPNAKMLDSESNQESFSIGKLSRTSSGSSLASTTTCSSATLASTSPSATIPLDELPDRALTRILFFVGPLDRIRLERVSKHWLELSTKAWAQSRSLHFCEEPELLRHFNKSFPMCHAHLKAILRRCGPHIRSLSLADINQLFDENSVLEIGALCPELTNLNLSSITASPETLRVLSESFPKLTKIAYCGMTQTNEKAFLFLLKSMASRLRSVDFRGCARLKGSFFTLFGTALEEVLLDGCILLDNHVIEDLSVRCNCIHTFKLDGCRKLNDESLSLISRNFNGLTTLTLCGVFPLFTNKGLKQISRISSLQTLSLDYNPLVDDNLLSSVSDNLQNLRKFTLSFAGTDCQITTNGLCLLAKFRKLEELDLSGLAALNVQVLKSICNDGCLELRTIFLRNCSYLGDDGIPELGNLKKLENVDLSGCILVSNESILKLCGLFKNEAYSFLFQNLLSIFRQILMPIQLKLLLVEQFVNHTKFGVHTALGLF
uniref:F-box domain-containing protein n=1 Tax=Meloidogyne incognita TaxID=6306 RepID=A0A914KRL0_MELIC